MALDERRIQGCRAVTLDIERMDIGAVLGKPEVLNGWNADGSQRCAI